MNPNTDFDTMMWIFSTVSQTLGALVAVVGMVSIYKLDRISNSIGKIFEGIRVAVINGKMTTIEIEKLYSYGVKAWIEDYPETHEKIKRFNRSSEIKGLTQEMEKEYKSRRKIIDNFKIFLKTNLIVICGSIVFIIIGEHVYVSMTSKWILYIIVVSSLIYCLYTTYNLSQSILD